MRIFIRRRGQLLLSSVLCSALIASCGGSSGNTPANAQTAASSAPIVLAAPANAPLPTVLASAPSDPSVPAAPVDTPSTAGVGTAAAVGTPVVVGAVITDFNVASSSSTVQNKLPISFGQMFKQGEFLTTEQLSGIIGDHTVLPLQVDVKATYPDNSVRHAVISAVIPTLAAGEEITVSLQKTGGANVLRSFQSCAGLLASGFDSKVTVLINGQRYTASAADQLVGMQPKSWLAGNIVNEWLVAAPLRSDSGAVHPHLMARFDIRDRKSVV